MKFDAAGKLVRSFGGGMFVFPHGIHVDAQGNVWVVDGLPPARRPRGRTRTAVAGGHHIVKFSPDGKVLLRLGMPGMTGDDAMHFNQPSDVITAPNGDIFVADGHGGDSNARIVKYDRTGKFIKTWGTRGSGRGQLDAPHALAMDSKGRLFVADRANNRIQIFDQNGTYLDEWHQFSRPSGVYIDKNDVIYVADSESNKSRKTRRVEARHPHRQRARRQSDGVHSRRQPQRRRRSAAGTSGPEGVAADAQGNVYGAEVGQKGIKKYVRK